MKTLYDIILWFVFGNSLATGYDRSDEEKPKGFELKELRRTKFTIEADNIEIANLSLGFMLDKTTFETRNSKINFLMFTEENSSLNKETGETPAQYHEITHFIDNIFLKRQYDSGNRSQFEKVHFEKVSYSLNLNQDSKAKTDICLEIGLSQIQILFSVFKIPPENCNPSKIQNLRSFTFFLISQSDKRKNPHLDSFASSHKPDNITDASSEPYTLMFGITNILAKYEISSRIGTYKHDLASEKNIEIFDIEKSFDQKKDKFKNLGPFQIKIKIDSFLKMSLKWLEGNLIKRLKDKLKEDKINVDIGGNSSSLDLSSLYESSIDGLKKYIDILYKNETDLQVVYFQKKCKYKIVLYDGRWVMVPKTFEINKEVYKNALNEKLYIRGKIKYPSLIYDKEKDILNLISETGISKNKGFDPLKADEVKESESKMNNSDKAKSNVEGESFLTKKNNNFSKKKALAYFLFLMGCIILILSLLLLIIQAHKKSNTDESNVSESIQ